jgi:hypothetical protein
MRRRQHGASIFWKPTDLDPWPPDLGVRPRPTNFQRQLLLVHGGELLLRLLQSLMAMEVWWTKG